MPPRGVPSGPRAAGQSSRQSNFRHSARGGIQKRGTTPLRTDRDGDFDMSEAAVGEGRAARSGRGTSIHGAAASQRSGTPEAGSRSRGRPRIGIDAAAVQRAVLREMGADERVTKASTARHSHASNRTQDGLETIRVKGLRQSKAASNRDGGIGDLLAFLERKATHPNEAQVKIKKSRMEGDSVLVFVKSSDATRILKLDGFSFAGAQLNITGSKATSSLGKIRPSESEVKVESSDTIQVLKDFLGRRYNAANKLLDLSQTGSDAQLIAIGMFKTTTTESKFFPALMKVCEGVFASAKEKEDAVHSVSLANNSLPTITAVTTLAQTFPDLRNLDLSNNKISDLKALEAWRWKFRKLQNLVLTGNPIDFNKANAKGEILRWFPELTTLNGILVRSQEDVETLKAQKSPLPILGPSFRDEGGVAENFLKQFFLGFDSDRDALCRAYYDSASSFSLNINVSAPRNSEGNTAAPAKWDKFIRRSRNLSKIGNLNQQQYRLYKGADSVRDCFTSLPATKHPEVLTQPEKWCMECNSIPGLPDISGQSPTGVGGLLVIAHGEFNELDPAKGTVIATRSFDRTFILGPGDGLGGIRVICDTLSLRSHGGSAAWTSELHNTPQPAGIQPEPQQLPSTSQNIGVSANGKSVEQVQREALALELSARTKMTIEYSVMCLEQSGWDLLVAAARFEEVKSSLPANAFT